jgi:hypothetical protein
LSCRKIRRSVNQSKAVSFDYLTSSLAHPELVCLLLSKKNQVSCPKKDVDEEKTVVGVVESAAEEAETIDRPTEAVGRLDVYRTDFFGRRQQAAVQSVGTEDADRTQAVRRPWRRVGTAV